MKNKKNTFDNYDNLKDDNYNNLDIVSIEILNTVNEIQNLPTFYKKFKNNIDPNNENENILFECFFNKLEGLFWINFCNQMRDYADIVYKLLIVKRKNKTKIIYNNKYLEVWEYVKNTKFISKFVNINCGDKYSALSFTLHNFNKLTFRKENCDETLRIMFQEFQQALHNDINVIKKELEEIINLFRKCSLKPEECQTKFVSVNLRIIDSIFYNFLYLFLNKNN